MTAYNPEIFTTFLFDTLSNDVDVAALAGGIYTYVPQDTNPPYLLIEVNRIAPLHAAELSAVEVEFSIIAYSQEQGFSTIFDMMEKSYIALQGKTATLSGHQVTNTRLITSKHNRVRDGEGIEASLTFRSVVVEL